MFCSILLLTFIVEVWSFVASKDICLCHNNNKDSLLSSHNQRNKDKGYINFRSQWKPNCIFYVSCSLFHNLSSLPLIDLCSLKKMIQNFQFASFICFVLLDLLFLTSIFEVWLALQRTIQKNYKNMFIFFQGYIFHLERVCFLSITLEMEQKKVFLAIFSQFFPSSFFLHISSEIF